MNSIRIVFLINLFSMISFAGPLLNYHGRILDANARPLESAKVLFRIKIYTPGGTGQCLLYEDSREISMVGSQGVFVIAVGGNGGLRTPGVDPGIPLTEVFSNNVSLVIDRNKYPLFTCGSGLHSYTPQATHGRQLQLSFDDYTGLGEQELPLTSIDFVPFAINAHDSQNIGGYTASSILRVSGGSASPLTPANFLELMNLLNGTTAHYEKPGNLNGVGLPPSFNEGEVLGWSGGTWQAVSPSDASVKIFAKTDLPSCGANQFLKHDGSGSLICVTESIGGGGGGTVTSVGAGTGLKNISDPGNPITVQGTLTVDVGTGANQILQMGGDTKLPAVDGSKLTNIVATNIRGVPVSAAPTLEGQVLRYQGGSLVPSFVSMLDLRSNVTGNLALSATCGVSQTFTYNSATDSLKCESISLTKSQVSDFPTLATVATSGNYNDLSNKPTIPVAQINSDWNAVSGLSQILNKPTLGTLAGKSSIDLSTSEAANILPISKGGTGANSVAQGLVFAGPAGSSGAPSFRAIASTDLPASASFWQSATGGINYAGGNVGIGNTSPKSALHVENGAYLKAAGADVKSGVTILANGATAYQGGLYIGNSASFIDGVAGHYGFKFSAMNGTSSNAGLRIGLVEASTPGTYVGNNITLRGGNVGIGNIASPTATLEVAGEVKFGNTAGTCDASAEGQQRYNSSLKRMEFCNGSAWSSFGGVRMMKTTSSTVVTSALPVTTGASDFKVLYSVPVTIKSGDQLIVMAEAEFTNPYTYNVMVGSYLVLASTAGSTTGTTISYSTVRNVTPAMHHEIHNKGGMITSAVTGNYYINLIGYAASDSAGVGHNIIVESPNYGKVDVIKLSSD